MKKLLLSLGTIAAVVAPVVSVVACGAPAKPAPIALDETKVDAMLPKVKEALAKAFGDPESGQTTPISEGTVSVNGDNFDMVFKIMNTADIKITVNPSGTIEKVTPPAGYEDKVPANLKDELEALMKGATVDHSKDSIPVFDFEIAKFDKDIVAEMAQAGIIPPVLADDKDHDQIEAFNDAVEAFEKTYKQTIAKDALDLLSDDMTLTIPESEYDDMVIGSADDQKPLDEDLMKKLGIESTTITSILKYMDLGATVSVHKEVGTDLEGRVDGVSDDIDGGIN